GSVIGPRGAIIKELVEVTGAQIDVDEEGGRGVVKIYANSRAVADDALDRINAIANPQLPEKGERYHATVVKTVDFGAFVNLTPGTDGLLHISELSKIVGRRLDHAEEAVNVGDQVLVEVKDILDGGRKFKLEYVGEQTGESKSDDDGGRDRGGSDRDSGGSDAGGRDSGGSDGDGGGRDRGGRARGGRNDARGDADEDRGGDRSGGGTRTRTRSRSRERD
ncbi:MAG: S1 RNA-binding domain-containing protein, partial [Nitriliruptoraceae bacterium]